MLPRIVLKATPSLLDSRRMALRQTQKQPFPDAIHQPWTNKSGEKSDFFFKEVEAVSGKVAWVDVYDTTEFDAQTQKIRIGLLADTCLYEVELSNKTLDLRAIGSMLASLMKHKLLGSEITISPFFSYKKGKDGAYLKDNKGRYDRTLNYEFKGVPKLHDSAEAKAAFFKEKDLEPETYQDDLGKEKKSFRKERVYWYRVFAAVQKALLSEQYEAQCVPNTYNSIFFCDVPNPLVTDTPTAELRQKANDVRAAKSMSIELSSKDRGLPPKEEYQRDTQKGQNNPQEQIPNYAPATTSATTTSTATTAGAVQDDLPF